MDDFVEHMLKSAKEKRKTEAQSPDVDPEEIERLTQEIKEKAKDK